MSFSKWMTAVTIVAILTATGSGNLKTIAMSLSNCPKKCGGVTIPYPFGIGKGCYHSLYFNITCNYTFNPAKPIYGDNMEVLEINVIDAHIRMSNDVARECYQKGDVTYQFSPQKELGMIAINNHLNTFVATGCDTIGLFYGNKSRHGDIKNRTYKTACVTQCCMDDVENGTCAGAGCCEIRIPKNVRSISIVAASVSNYATTNNFTPCSSAFVVAKDSLNFTLANLTITRDQMPNMFPVVYDWTIGNETCTTAQEKGDCLCCGANRFVKCFDTQLGGYQCSCLPGFFGNPYLPQGCQDIDECSNGPGNTYCKEPAMCDNTEGSYNCVCPNGFHGNGTINHPCVPNNHQVAIITSVSGSVIFLLVLSLLLHWHHGKKKIKEMRESFFQQNGGMILLEKLPGRDKSIDLIKIFTVEDLKNATNNYSEDNIAGRGGFGMVYKGTLQNNQVVAVKKSIKVDASQKEQFVTEVLLLSQLNNKNVVKLIGCCLEDEVPLLVYEFIGNGTLYEHLHDERKADLLSWNIRLRIATEVAEVLAYLHTTISTPIIHRDMKPANILLDENYVAKVSDFGASRTLVPIDKNQEATMVQGTRGYLDPEYMQTGELNEKSDVYSFGVVVVQLLTGREVISYDRPEKERILAMHFLTKFKEQRVSEIIDQKIKSEGVIEQFEDVAILARRCLEVKGEDRPTMKEVARELERIRRKDVHLWPSSNVGLCEDEGQYLLGRTLKDSSSYLLWGKHHGLGHE